MNEEPRINNPEPLDRDEARRQPGRLSDPSRPGAWVAGVILIVVGAMFLMRNLGTFDIPLKNWWALFILIPAIGSFDTALRAYRSAGNEWTEAARRPLLGGAILTFVSIMFLFNISWTFFGPILIILVGVGILVTYLTGNKY